MPKNTAPENREPFIASLDTAPLPTPGTLRKRRNILYQLGRFTASNLRLAVMVFSPKS
ncbi:MAG TPA: hypothetical protein VFC72_03540 [Corynebacterium sp.]|nr:hypothetical protein [Corynebacterium sp.]